MESLPEVVKNNLIFQHHWENVEIVNGWSDSHLLFGHPPQGVYASVETGQWVLSTLLGVRWTLKKWHDVFAFIPQGTGQKKLTMAIVSSDSTIIYYVVHDGLIKPRQN